MYVGLIKIGEAEKYVYYRIDTRVEDCASLNKHNKPDVLWKTIYAYCVFNKETEEMEFRWDRSHIAFMDDTLRREKIRAHYTLMKIKGEKQEYPPFICINTGG